MAKSDSLGLGHMVILLLLLSILFHHSESALPSDLQNLSIPGRRMMAYYKPSGYTGPSTSPHARASKAPRAPGCCRG